jgi:hypothetical protein
VTTLRIVVGINSPTVIQGLQNLCNSTFPTLVWGFLNIDLAGGEGGGESKGGGGGEEGRGGRRSRIQEEEGGAGGGGRRREEEGGGERGGEGGGGGRGKGEGEIISKYGPAGLAMALQVGCPCAKL